jgi:hypothetical protein
MTYELTPVQVEHENHFAFDRDTFAPPKAAPKSKAEAAAQDLNPGQPGSATHTCCAGAISTTRENQ